MHRRTQNEKRINERAEHYGNAAEPYSPCNRVVEMQPSKRRQDRFPIVSFNLGGRAAQHRELQRSRIIYIWHEVEEAFAGPPDAYGGAERIILLKQERPCADQRQEHLKKAAAE